MWFTTLLIKNLLRRKTRSILTCMGIAVAVGTTVALLGISDGFERSTIESFESRGVHIVVIQAGVPNQLSSKLDQGIKDRIATLPHVSNVACGLIEFLDVGGNPTMLQGWEVGSFLFDQLDVVEGRELQSEDGRATVLGRTLAANLNVKVGEAVEILEEPYKIVGIYESNNVYDNGSIIVPLEQMQKDLFLEQSVTGCSVVVEPTWTAKGNIEEVCAEINAITDANGRGLSARPTTDYVQGSMHIQIAHAMAWMTSVIAVIVGAVGMLNTMIMSVVERIREISILRAIGWKKWRVTGMILGEAVILSLLGAVFGAVVAVLLTRYLSTLPAASGLVSGRIAPIILAKGFLFALVVGVLGGSYPAYHATRLLPADGLRSE